MKQVLNGILCDSEKAELIHRTDYGIECYDRMVDEEGNEFMYCRWYDMDGRLKKEFIEEVDRSNDEWLDRVLNG